MYKYFCIFRCLRVRAVYVCVSIDYEKENKIVCACFFLSVRIYMYVSLYIIMYVVVCEYID